MDPLLLRLGAASLGCFSILSACGPGGGGSHGPAHARLTLVADPAGFVPGEETLLGVSFLIEPEWHLYWNGQNDTGYPPRIEVELPTGFAAGELQWPAPNRHISPGGILDHVYTGRVTLLLPVRAPESAKPGGKTRIRVRADWLACKSECIPEQGKASLSLPVFATREEFPPPDRESEAWIDQARQDLPKPASLVEAGVEASWAGDTLVVRVPGDRPAAFYPDTASVTIDDLLHQGESAVGRLQLRTRLPGTQVSGVLAIREAAGPDTVYFHIRVPLPPADQKETN